MRKIGIREIEDIALGAGGDVMTAADIRTGEGESGWRFKIN